MSEHQQNRSQVLPGIAVIVRNGDRVLLNKRKNVHGAGTWAPIAGHLDFGESLEQCAMRETKEESGLDISNIKFRCITNDVFETEHKHYITIWMEATCEAGTPTLSAPEEEA